MTAKVTDLLDAENMAYEIYSDIKPNPTIENVKAGVAAYKASGADYMITIGGGYCSRSNHQLCDHGC